MRVAPAVNPRSAHTTRRPPITRTRLAAPLLLLAVAGCATSAADAVAQREKLLAASGFLLRPADTPQRTAMLAQLTPDRISRMTRGDHVSYVYPDPAGCHCLYVGGQVAYGQYERLQFEQKLANEQVQTAELNEQLPWDWGVWGGFGQGMY
jgi:hypothetical protein